MSNQFLQDVEEQSLILKSHQLLNSYVPLTGL